MAAEGPDSAARKRRALRRFDAHRSARPKRAATTPRDLPQCRVNSNYDGRENWRKVLTVREADTDLIATSVLAQYSKDELCKLTLVLSSKRPLGVRSMMLGGRNGYSAGSRMRKWYSPPSKSVPAGPRRVQCHSCSP